MWNFKIVGHRIIVVGWTLVFTYVWYVLEFMWDCYRGNPYEICKQFIQQP